MLSDEKAVSFHKVAKIQIPNLNTKLKFHIHFEYYHKGPPYVAACQPNFKILKFFQLFVSENLVQSGSENLLKNTTVDVIFTMGAPKDHDGPTVVKITTETYQVWSFRARYIWHIVMQQKILNFK